jgi:hypothetical protein
MKNIKRMKKIISSLLVIVFLLIHPLFLSAQEIKSPNPLEEKNSINIIYPEIEFDTIEAKKALENGSATIKGVLFTKEKTRLGFKPLFGVKIFGANLNVTLFPVTTYFENWYQLRRKKENKRTKIHMSKEAFSKKIVVTTDDYGNFIFKNMKPGKYFLQAFMNTDYNYYNTINVGAETNSSGGTTFYNEKQYFTISQDERIEKFVEIKENEVNITLKLK